MKPVGPRRVGDDAVGPSSDAMAGKGRHQPEEKKNKMKSHEKSPSVLPPTGSVMSPQHSACTVTEKSPAGAEEASPKQRVL